MDLTSCLASIADAEEKLRQAAADTILSSSNYDQKRVGVFLEGANQLRRVAQMIDPSLDSQSTDVSFGPAAGGRMVVEHDSHDGNAALPVRNEQPEYPLCFFADNRLYKVGLSGVESDGTQKRWWKSVSCEEAKSIMQFMIDKGDGGIRRKDVVDALEIPKCRFDVVISALKIIGAVQPSEHRGCYKTTGGTVADWISQINSLPVRKDLLNR